MRKNMKKNIPTRIKDKAVNEYFKGKSVPELCKKYKVKKSAIYSWIKESKDNIKTSSFEMKERNIINVVTLVLKGDSVKSVCKKYNLKPSTVYYWVNKYQNQVLENKPIIRKKKEENLDNLKLSITIFKQVSKTNDMSLQEKIELIYSLRETYSISLLCDLFDVGRNTYYKYINKDIPSHILRDQKLKPLVKEAYVRHNKVIGAEKIQYDLQLQGHTVSYKKVRQLMQELSIEKIALKKKTPFIKPPKKTNQSCTNLLNQEFNQMAPNLVWVSDVTEIKINQKPVYLCAVMDLYSRKIIAHQISRKNNTRLTMNTYKIAIHNRKTVPNMFHSDRGVNYTAHKFQRLLSKYHVKQSFSAPGYPFDNAVIESFFSQYKRETVKQMLPFNKIQDYIKMVYNYIKYYNQDRFHKGLGMLTPNLKEKIHYKLSPTFV